MSLRLALKRSLSDISDSDNASPVALHAEKTTPKVTPQPNKSSASHRRTAAKSPKKKETLTPNTPKRFLFRGAVTHKCAHGWSIQVFMLKTHIRCMSLFNPRLYRDKTPHPKQAKDTTATTSGIVLLDRVRTPHDCKHTIMQSLLAHTLAAQQPAGSVRRLR